MTISSENQLYTKISNFRKRQSAEAEKSREDRAAEELYAAKSEQFETALLAVTVLDRYARADGTVFGDQPHDWPIVDTDLRPGYVTAERESVELEYADREDSKGEFLAKFLLQPLEGEEGFLMKTTSIKSPKALVLSGKPYDPEPYSSGVLRTYRIPASGPILIEETSTLHRLHRRYLSDRYVDAGRETTPQIDVEPSKSTGTSKIQLDPETGKASYVI